FHVTGVQTCALPISKATEVTHQDKLPVCLFGDGPQVDERVASRVKGCVESLIGVEGIQLRYIGVRVTHEDTAVVERVNEVEGSRSEERRVGKGGRAG